MTRSGWAGVLPYQVSTATRITCVKPGRDTFRVIQESARQPWAGHPIGHVPGTIKAPQAAYPIRPAAAGMDRSGRRPR